MTTTAAVTATRTAAIGSADEHKQFVDIPYPEQDLTLLAKTPAYTGVRFTVWNGLFKRKDSDEQYQREWIEPGNCVAVLPYDEKRGVLYLARQMREPVGREVLALCAGKIDPGEEQFPAKAAARELEEELGINAGGMTRIGGYFSSQGITDEYTHVYLAQDLSFRGGGPTDVEERVDIVTVAVENIEHYIEKADNAQLLVGLRFLQNQLLEERLDRAVERLDALRQSITDAAHDASLDAWADFR